MTLNKNIYILSLLVILLFIKFIFLPLDEAQTELQDEVKLLVKKRAKLESLIEQEQELNQIVAVNQQVLTTELDKLWSLEKLEDFKVSSQKWLQQLITENKLDLLSLTWSKGLALEPVSEQILTLRVKGKVKSLMIFTAQVESQETFTVFSQWSLNLDRRKQREDTLGQGTATFKISFYTKEKL